MNGDGTIDHVHAVVNPGEGTISHHVIVDTILVSGKDRQYRILHVVPCMSISHAASLTENQGGAADCYGRAVPMAVSAKASLQHFAFGGCSFHEHYRTVYFL